MLCQPRMILLFKNNTNRIVAYLGYKLTTQLQYFIPTQL